MDSGGFNYDNAVYLVHVLDLSNEESEEVINELRKLLSNIIFESSWFSPEAIKFEKNVFEPIIREMYDNNKKIYSNILSMLREATKEWCYTTGVSYIEPKAPSIDNASNTHFFDYQRAKKEDVNGNVIIDISLPETIRKQKNNRMLLNRIDDAKSTVRRVKNIGVFLDYKEQDYLNKQLDDLIRSIEGNYNLLFEKAIIETKKSVDKYQRVAKKISSSFTSKKV